MMHAHFPASSMHRHRSKDAPAARPLVLSILSESGLFDGTLSDSFSLERMIDRIDTRETDR